VDDGRQLLAAAVQVELVQDEEELADGAEYSLDLLAVGGLVRGLDEQFLGASKGQPLVLLDPQEQLPVVVLVVDGLDGGRGTSVVKSCR
jgi:hypothetical protein